VDDIDETLERLRKRWLQTGARDGLTESKGRSEESVQGQVRAGTISPVLARQQARIL